MDVKGLCDPLPAFTGNAVSAAGHAQTGAKVATVDFGFGLTHPTNLTDIEDDGPFPGLTIDNLHKHRALILLTAAGRASYR